MRPWPTPDQSSANVVLELKVVAAEPDGVVLDLHPVACICGGTHVTDLLVLTHDPGWVLHYPGLP